MGKTMPKPCTRDFSLVPRLHVSLLSCVFMPCFFLVCCFALLSCVLLRPHAVHLPRALICFAFFSLSTKLLLPVVVLNCFAPVRFISVVFLCLPTKSLLPVELLHPRAR